VSITKTQLDDWEAEIEHWRGMFRSEQKRNAELVAALEMAENRLDAALMGDDICRHCVILAKSYLTDVLQQDRS